MKIRRTYHQKAESFISDAASLIAAARESLDFAADANDSAHEIHKALIEHHGEALREASARKARITETRKQLS